MQAMPELVDVDAAGGEETRQVVLDIDREAARRLGVDMATIASVLNNSFSQRQVATLYDELNQYRVVMELDPRFTSDPAVLEQVEVVTAEGSRVPLSTFASWGYGMASDRVRHDGQFASVGVGYALAPGVTAYEAEQAIERMLAEIMLPASVHTVPASVGRGRCAAGTATERNQLQSDRAARTLSADRRGDEERDHDDRLCPGGAAPGRSVPAGGHPSGRTAAPAPHSDDQPGRVAWRRPAGARVW